MQRRDREWFFEVNADRDVNSGRVLAGFVATLADDLNVITAQRSELFADRLEVAGSVIEVLQRAWGEVVETVPDAWEEVGGLDEAVLTEAGLTGQQLRLKIAAWDESRQVLDRMFGSTESALEHVPEGANLFVGTDVPLFGAEGALAYADAYSPRLPILTGHPRRLWGRLLRRIWRTLGYADTILGSIPVVKGAVEPIKEYKEIVENLSADAGDIRTQ